MDYKVKEEKVVLLDEDLNRIGTAEKALVHTGNTPLHLAFSCFLFNGRGELLVQQRALEKVTWPGVWTNSCCGHPLPDEEIEEAVYRRLEYELGIARGEVEIREALPDYRYKAEFLGVVENEFCPVWIGLTERDPAVNTKEVEAIDYLDWEDFVRCLRDESCNKFDHFSVWCKEEALLLDDSNLVNKLLNR